MLSICTGKRYGNKYESEGGISMPHTKLKVLSILIIISGVFSLLGGLCVVVAVLLAGDVFVSLLVAENLSETMVKVLIGYTAVFYLIRGGLELFTGIAGVRFSNGSIDEKFSRIPAVILLALHGLNLVIKIITGGFGNLLGAVLWLAITGAYFAYVMKVEEYNRTRPSVEDTPLFNLKDGY